MSLTTDVIDLLRELGDTEEDVAAKLAELRIKGTPCSGEDCPVATYLSTNGVFHFGVDPVRVVLPSGYVDVPPAVAEFIGGFDCREYPELIKAVGFCAHCATARATSVCCKAHDKELCHRCYRTTHFVQVCVDGCPECAVEGLPLLLDRAVMVL